MADHYVTVTFDGDYPTYGLVCQASRDSDCHRTPGPDCFCEEWIEQGVDDAGPYHLARVWDGEGWADEKAKHSESYDPAHCNYRDWLTAEPAIIPELMEGPPFTVQVPVRGFQWQGNDYSWEPGEPAKVDA